VYEGVIVDVYVVPRPTVTQVRVPKVWWEAKVRFRDDRGVTHTFRTSRFARPENRGRRVRIKWHPHGEPVIVDRAWGLVVKNLGLGIALVSFPLIGLAAIVAYVGNGPKKDRPLEELKKERK